MQTHFARRRGFADTHGEMAAHSEDLRTTISPHATAILSDRPRHHPSQRDPHLASIAAHGRQGWRKETNRGQHALPETAMGRCNAHQMAFFVLNDC